nr:LicD family protein [Treponema sp.]
PYNINLILSGGGLLGLVRNNGFLPWDDDIDVDAIRSEYEKILEIARTQWTWVDITESCDSLYKYYDDAIKNNPDKIVAIHTPWSLHIYRGTSIKDAVNIEFFPLDYMKDNVSAEELVEYKKYMKGKIKALSKNGFGKLLDFYEKEKEKSKVFSKEETDHIYYGIGNYGLTEYSFHSLIEKSDYFPLKKAVFEGVEVNIPLNSEKALSALFGNWEALPKDVGIAHTFEAINEYLRDNGQEEINYKDF